MRERNRSGRGERRRSGGDGEPDLFANQLSEVVQQAFAASGEGDEAKPAADGDEIHSRSVMLGSERLGVVAKMDLVEATLSRDGSVAAVQPVDYKVGAPREGADGLELWDADKMQLGLQCLV